MTRRLRKEPRRAPEASGQPLARGWLWSIDLLAGVALALSGYLLWGSLSGDRLPGCGPNSGCDAVLNSRWAYWFGIPVSAGALAAYAASIGMTRGLARLQPALTWRRYWGGLLSVALLVLGAAIWFIGLQAFVLRTFCPYCMTAHLCGATMGILILLAWRSVTAVTEPRAGSAIRTSAGFTLRLPSLVATALLSALVAGQVLHQGPTFVLQAMTAIKRSAPDQTSTREKPGIQESMASRSERPVGKLAGPFLELHDGLFRLDLGEVPLIGRPEAPQVVVSLFDYTCSQCRVAHTMLIETVRALSNQLAVVRLPVPLDGACNPVVKKPMPEHTNACAYARLGLAVWRADRRQMPIFDDWLFASLKPPTTNAAWEYAGRLVGTNALAQALRDPWIDAFIERDVRLYQTNYLRYAKGRLPQLIIGTNLVAGTPRSTPALLEFVCQQLGLARPGTVEPRP